jgi:hypothetical protein
MFKLKHLAAAGMALSLLAGPAIATAGEDGAQAPTAPPAAALTPAAESDAALNGLDGRGDVTINNSTAITDQDLTAVNSGNTITALNVGSGNISLSGDALSSFSGIGNFVMNTGHNNNLQGSISVTIIVTP